MLMSSYFGLTIALEKIKIWKLFNSLVNFVNQLVSPSKITMRYLTKRHTDMTSNGINGNVEKKMGRKRSIYDIQELEEMVKNCRKILELFHLNEF